MKQKKDGFLKLVFKFSIATWINFAVGLISSSVGTRIVPPELYGLYNTFNSAVTVAMYVCILGMDSSLMRFFFEVPNDEDRRVFLCRLGLISMGATLAATVVCCAAYRFVSVRLFGIESLTVVLLMFVCVAANVVLRYLNVIYRMRGDAKQYTVQNVLLQTVMRLSVILAVLIRPNFTFILAVEALGVAAMAVVYLRVQRKDLMPPRESRNKLLCYAGYGPCIRFGLFTAPAYIITTLNTLLAQELIRVKMSAHDLGVYGSASYFVALLNVVNGGFSTFWAGYLYANYRDEQKKIVQIQEFLLLILSVVFVGILLFRDLIYLILIGVEYRASKPVVALVLIPPLLEILGQTCYCGINVRKKNQILLYTSLLMVGLNVALMWVLIPAYGLLGAALSGALASAVAFAINCFFGQRLYRTVESYPRFGFSIANLLFLAFVNAFITSFWQMAVLLLIDLAAILLLYRQRLVQMLQWAKQTLLHKGGQETQ